MEDKENYVPAPIRGAGPAQRASPMRLVLAEIQSTASDLKTPTKICNANDPWTPTANLKMLISAASPDIRNREREMMEEQLSGDELERSQPSRKEKSLGLLCHKFLERYPEYPNPAVNNSICLDEVAGELHVERRRIYDIVNVLESLHMVSRLAKNKYLWHGRLNLSQTFRALQRVGEENRYAEQILLLKRREQEESGECAEPAVRLLIKQVEVGFVELPGVEFRAASVNSRKEKSLRVMSQRFVMLFLVSSPQVVSLDIAARILIGEDQLEDLDKSKFKTKIRRLYDIANVLSSLDLIKKVHVTEERGRKPAFQWTGPESSAQGEGANPTVLVAAPSLPAASLKSPKENCAKNLFAPRGKQSFTRHQSLIKLAKSIENDRRKINSAPSSPSKSGDAGPGSDSSSSKLAQLAAICKQKLDKAKDQNKVKVKTLRPASNGVKATLRQTSSELSASSGPAFPVISPCLHSHSSYAVYLPPQQAQLLASQNPGALGHPVLCAHKTPGQDEGNASSESVTNGAGMSPEKGQRVQNGPSHEQSARRLPNPGDCCSSKRMKGFSQSESSEALITSGYLIPVQLAPMLDAAKDPSSSPPEQSIFTSPLPGVIPLKLMFSPGSLALPVITQPGHSWPSPSASPHPQTTSPGGAASTNELSAKQVLNFNHLSPLPYHGQPIRVFTLPQGSVPLTPKGSHTIQESFFHTPGGSYSSPVNTVVAGGVPAGTIFISQRKLDVGADD
uniref:Transcription factor E2F8 n=1 Tax=Leptobrachium leishanense TaxID=445787 RepID=A0A8C5WAT4_9ANUR